MRKQKRGYGDRSVSVPEKIARKIMGANFFGVNDAEKHFGVKPTKRQLSALAEIPFTEERLRMCRHTHILAAVFPISIMRMGVKNRMIYFSRKDTAGEKFVRSRGAAGWELMRKTPADGSLSKNWKQQLDLLGENEKPPTARVATYILIGHYKSTGEAIFKKTWVRTACRFADGRRVQIMYFMRGIYIGDDISDTPLPCTGIASSEKPRTAP